MQRQFSMMILVTKAMPLSVFALLQKLAKNHFVGLQKMLAKRVTLSYLKFAH